MAGRTPRGSASTWNSTSHFLNSPPCSSWVKTSVHDGGLLTAVARVRDLFMMRSNFLLLSVSLSAFVFAISASGCGAGGGGGDGDSSSGDGDGDGDIDLGSNTGRPIDTNGDGEFDGIDLNGDGVADH